MGWINSHSCSSCNRKMMQPYSNQWWIWRVVRKGERGISPHSIQPPSPWKIWDFDSSPSQPLNSLLKKQMEYLYTSSVSSHFFLYCSSFYRPNIIKMILLQGTCQITKWLLLNDWDSSLWVLQSTIAIFSLVSVCFFSGIYVPMYCCQVSYRKHLNSTPVNLTSLQCHKWLQVSQCDIFYSSHDSQVIII